MTGLNTDFNLKFDAKAGVDAVKNDVIEGAKAAATDAIVSSLLSGGAAKETAATAKRATTGAADAAKTTADFAAQKQLCTAALNSLIQLAQTGELDLTQFQNTLKNQIIQSIKDNNAKGETVKESIAQLNAENQDIMAQISELNGGTLEGIELAGASEDADAPIDGDNPEDENTSKEKKTSNKKVDVNNPNSEKIQALIEKYNTNLGLISSMSTTLTSIKTEQANNVSQGDDVKSQAENKSNEISSNLQESGRNFFQQIGDGIRKIFGTGKAKQLGHNATGTTMTTADTAAGVAKTAEATGEGLGAMVTFGATGAAAAKAAAEATAFYSAATANMSFAGISMAKITSLATGEKAVGDLVAEQIQSKVNEKISGAVTEIATDIMGEEIASYVAPELTGALQVDMGKAPDEKSA